jgi:hypothetical protein
MLCCAIALRHPPGTPEGVRQTLRRLRRVFECPAPAKEKASHLGRLSADDVVAWSEVSALPSGNGSSRRGACRQGECSERSLRSQNAEPLVLLLRAHAVCNATIVPQSRHLGKS